MRYLTLLLAFIAFNSYAEGYCDETAQFFKNSYGISLVSDKKIRVIKLNDAKWVIELSIGEYFEGKSDRHSRTLYELKSITDKSINIIYSVTFDARSFGGKKEECAGEFLINHETYNNKIQPSAKNANG